MDNRQHRWCIAALLLAGASAAQAQGYTLEGAVIDTRNGQNLGVINERGDINSLFRAQKAMTFGILRSAGISLDQLAPEVRARIERFQTSNIEAFRAYSQGLDLKDQGRFAEAKAQFRRAAELDPAFGLATEQQQAMPDVNLGGNVTTRAVIAAAATAAVDRGKANVVVDTQRAVAAIAAGATVVTVNLPAANEAPKGYDYSYNNTGGGGQLLPRLVAGFAYSRQLPSGTVASVATAQEWRGDAYRTNGSVLESLGTNADFLALRQNAQNLPGDSVRLGDGSLAYWGAWLSAPGASAVVAVAGSPSVAPALGPVADYVFGNATVQMPTTGTASYTPAGGSLGAVTGSIQVNFVSKDVVLQNLGFELAGLSFSGLNGRASYDKALGGAGTASGGFSGRYSSGSCSGCATGAPFAGDFNGSFLGRDASGLGLATNLQTGYAAAPVVSGVHLFVKP